MQSLSKRAEDTKCCNKTPVTEAIKTEQRKDKEEKSWLDFSDMPYPPLLMISQTENVTFRELSDEPKMIQWAQCHS